VAKDWDAVAAAINTRLAELEMTQQELATAANVSTATLRELQQNRNPRRRSPRLLEAVSVGLKLPAERLGEVADGFLAEAGRDRVAVLEAEVKSLRARLQRVEDALEGS
jgi:transcriptional regulator with XRE-family HTH domain